MCPLKIKVTCDFNVIYFLTEAQINISITTPVFHGKWHTRPEIKLLGKQITDSKSIQKSLKQTYPSV